MGAIAIRRGIFHQKYFTLVLIKMCIVIVINFRRVNSIPHILYVTFCASAARYVQREIPESGLNVARFTSKWLFSEYRMPELKVKAWI